MGFNESVVSCLRQVFRLKGRATRAEYFWSLLFMLLLQGGAKLIGALEKVTAHRTLAWIQGLDGQVKLHELADPKSVIPSMLMVGGGFLRLFVAPLAVFYFTVQPGGSNYNKYDDE